MAMITAAVVTAGAGLYAAKEGKKEARRARQANQRQQDEALAFQKEMRDAALGEISKMQEGAYERILAAGKSRRGDALQSLAASGWSPGSSLGLSLNRAFAMDERNSLTNLASQMAGQRAAAYQGQSFPMIQHDTSAGARMQSAGYGMIGSALKGLAANWGTSGPASPPGTYEGFGGGLYTSGTTSAGTPGSVPYNPYQNPFG